jgi:hypothetical protein
VKLPDRIRPRLERAYARLGRGATAPPSGEAGADGDSALASLLAGGPDVNAELTGAAKFRVYDEMRKTDPSIRSTLSFLKLPVRSATWGLEPAERSPEALAVREFVAWNLGLEQHEGRLDVSFDELLQHLLTELDFGASLAELVWAEPQTWVDPDGEAHPVVPLARVAPRLPTTISRVQRDRGRIVRVEQALPGTRPIPGEKLVYAVWERDGDRWEGTSLLRPMWGAWRLRKHLLIVTGIGWDRYAGGLPVIWHPDTREGVERAKEIGRNLRTHERAYVHLPSTGGAGGPESEWRIELLQVQPTAADPTTLLRYLADQIAEVGLANFARQGLSQTGARATAEAQIDPFYLAVEALAKQLRLVIQRQIIRPLVAVNFGPEAAEDLLPQLTVSRIRARNVDVIARAISLLAEVGFTFTDRGAADDVRELLGLPRLPDDLDDRGIPRDQVIAALRQAGLDPETLARVLDALPPEIGVARNRVEGGPLLQ